MSTMTLYNYFRSSTSYRARIALNIKGLNFTYKAINLLKAEQRSEDYLKINPLGGLPTLVHNERNIPDSMALIEYLEEVYPTPPLLPQDPYLRARVRQVCEIVNSFMHPMGNLRTLTYLEKKHGYTQEQKEEWMAVWLPMGLDSLEKTIKEFAGTYSFGNEVTMADILLIPQLFTCNRFKVDVSAYPTLAKINENCLKLPAFQKAHPLNQPDTP